MKAEPSEKLWCSDATSAEHPRDRWCVGRCLRDKRTANALAPKLWGNDDHGEVAVGQTICDGTGETDDLATWRNRNDGALTSREQHGELRKRANTVRPTIGREKLIDSLRLGRPNATDLHAA
jgi:hypothetical protein